MIGPPIAGATDARLLEAWAAGGELTQVRRAELLLEVAGMDPSTELPLGAVDGRLLALREHCFGPHVDLMLDCTACGQRLQVGFEVADLRTETSGGESSEVSSVDGAVRVRFRSPTLADLRAAEAAGSVAAARGIVLRRCVTEAHRGSARIDPASLPEEIVARIGEAMAAANGEADIRLSLRCPDCGHAWEPAFDVGAFLWMEIDAHVRRLLVDVHTLARAYGWTEAEILSLPTARRQAYLELVLG